MPEIKIRDIKMHYEISGKGSPLLFIHGLGSDNAEDIRHIFCQNKLHIHYRALHGYDISGNLF